MVESMIMPFKPDWISPPGDTIADLLEERDWTQAEFASRMGTSRKFVNQLISGKVSLSESIAVKLERVLGSTVRFWLNREAGYRAALADKRAIESLREEVGWLEDLPISHMRKFKWIPSHRDKARTVAECLRFFGVGSVTAWKTWSSGLGQTAYRMSDAARTQFGAITAWLRCGELQALEIDCAPYSRELFRSSLETLRDLTREEKPDEFIPRMQELCAAAGVAVVFAPAPKGCPASGATRWLSQDQALLMLSLRYKSNDHLWFTFFHEAGHILLHRKKLMFLEMGGNGDQQEEEEADRFAANLLIPPRHRRELCSLRQTRVEVEGFARRTGIAPGIVVGRLQFEGRLPRTHLNELKVRYTWS